MTSHNILVMGVGRSGTTALYGLLQHILEDRYPGDVDYVYEPFLWDRKTFNKPYSQLTDEFHYVDSVSVEGMYHHKQLPMLVGDDSVIDQSSKDWLAKTISPTGGKRHYLGKLIRANGRIRLIRQLAPAIRIIFVIRNPVDVLNSASQLFSFFGREFYASDLPRFTQEVARHFGQHIETRTDALSKISAEYAFWYFSNRAFLEYAKSHSKNILTLAYEAFIEDRERLVRRTCEFLGLEYKQEFVAASKERMGPVRQGFNALTQQEFNFVKGRVGSFAALLELVDERPTRLVEELIKTTGWIEGELSNREAPAFNAAYACTSLQLKESRLQTVEGELHRIKSSRRYRLINWILKPLDRMKAPRGRREAS